jgi:hypothetical protein
MLSVIQGESSADNNNPDTAKGNSIPRKKFRFRRILFLLMMIPIMLLILIIAAAALTPPQTTGRIYSSRMSDILGFRTSASSIDFGWFSHISLQNLRFGGIAEYHGEVDPDSLQMLAIGALDIHLKPLAVFDRNISVDSISVREVKLNICWQDSLWLPAWLAAAPEESTQTPAETGSTASIDTHGFSSSATKILVENLQINLVGYSSGKIVDLRSPPLNFAFDLPALSTADIDEILAGNLPRGLTTRILSEWSGYWDNESGKAPLAPYLSEYSASDPGFRITAPIKQNMDFDCSSAGDTLNLNFDFALALESFAIDFQGILPDLDGELTFSIIASLPLLADYPQLQIESEWGFGNLNSSGDFRASLSSESWQSLLLNPQMTIDAELYHSMDLKPLAGLLSVIHPDSANDLSGKIDVNLKLAGLLDTGLKSSLLDVSQEFNLDNLQLVLPGYGISIDSLNLEESLRLKLIGTETAEFDFESRISDGLININPTVYAGDLLLPQRLQLLECADLDIALGLNTASQEDSISLSCDLSLSSILDTRIDISTATTLPPIEEILKLSETPLTELLDLALYFDLESGKIDLQGLYPDIAGAGRISSSINTGNGRLNLGFSIVPDDFTYSFDETTLEFPFYSLGFSMSLWPDSLLEKIWHCDWSFNPDPLTPMQGEMVFSENGGGQLSWDWEKLRLAGLLKMIPGSGFTELPDFKASGKIDMHGFLELGDTWMPTISELDLNWSRGRFSGFGYGFNRADSRIELFWNPDSMICDLEFSAKELSQEEPKFSWQGLTCALNSSVAYSSREMIGLPAVSGANSSAEGKIEFALASLGLTGDLKFESSKWEQLDSWILELILGIKSENEALHPWPGLIAGADMQIEMDLFPQEEKVSRLECLIAGDIDSLLWQEQIRIDQMVLDLALLQDLIVDLENPQLIHLAIDPPVGWNSNRSLYRGEEAEKTWSLTTTRVAYDNWHLEDLALDLRLMQGRLDCPQFQLDAYQGQVMGSFFVDRLMDPIYHLDCRVTGVNSRMFSFGRTNSSKKDGKAGRLDLILDLSGKGIDLDALENISGHLRFPELGREVTVNLLRLINQYTVDPNIGRVRKLLSLPGFRYRVESLDFELNNGFVNPRVSLRKSFLSPLPDISLPMSPLPLNFMVRNFALSEEETNE